MTNRWIRGGRGQRLVLSATPGVTRAGRIAVLLRSGVASTRLPRPRSPSGTARSSAEPRIQAAVARAALANPVDALRTEQASRSGQPAVGAGDLPRAPQPRGDGPKVGADVNGLDGRREEENPGERNSVPGPRRDKGGEVLVVAGQENAATGRRHLQKGRIGYRAKTKEHDMLDIESGPDQC